MFLKEIANRLHQPISNEVNQSTLQRGEEQLLPLNMAVVNAMENVVSVNHLFTTQHKNSVLAVYDAC